MCVTTLAAELKRTYIGNWDIWHAKFGYRHVLTYQNSPQNLADGPNCMMLHIQSRMPLNPANIIDTSKAGNLLKDISLGMLPISRTFAPQNHVIEMGIYHIALLNDPSSAKVEQTLSRIPPEKRPRIPDDYIEFYADVFEGFPLVLCCFNNRESKNASPIMVHYDPIYPEIFMFNTLDGHGKLPVIGERHQFHQVVVTGSYKINEAGNGFVPFQTDGISSHLLPWIPEFGTAEQVNCALPNLDLLTDARIVGQGGDAVLSMGLLN